MQLAPSAVAVVVPGGASLETTALPLLSQLLLHGPNGALLNSSLPGTRRTRSNSAGTTPPLVNASAPAPHPRPPLSPTPTTHTSPRFLASISFPSPKLTSLLKVPCTSLIARHNASFSTSSSSGTGSGTGSSSQSSTSNGPHELLASKCRVLPFSLGRDEAEAEWRRHHEGFFTSQPVDTAAVKASLMPYWCIATEAHVAVHSAQIGHDYLTSRYNRTTRRYEPRWETSWTSVVPNWRYSRRWGSEAEETQVYGGSKYRHDPALARMKPGEYARQALTYSDYVRRSAGDLQQRQQPDRMVPFRLGPEDAVEAARQAVRHAELRNAEHQLLQTYGGDRVRLVAMDVQLAGLTATPVFVPVYVFKTRVRGTALRTYVAGFRSGLSSGPLLPNPTRVAAVTAVAGAPLALWLSGALGGPGWTSATVLGLGLSYLIGYGVARLWPELHANLLRLRARLQRPLPDAAAEEQERWWRYEWVRQDTDEYAEGQGYSDFDSRSRRNAGGFGGFGGFRGFDGSGAQQQGRQGSGGGAGAGDSYGGWQQQQRQTAGAAGGGATRGSASDPKGYYRTLGVSPGSSTEDIQAAFRAAALKWHPDRQPDPSRKADSTRQFQAAQEAYSVLRDPNRRAAYDRGV